MSFLMLPQLERLVATGCQMVNSVLGSTIIYFFCDVNDKYCCVNVFIINDNACVHAKRTYCTDILNP